MKKSFENNFKKSKEELPNDIEVEKMPHYFIMITRHAERLPSGELSPEGIASSKFKDKKLEDVEVFKSYVSDHPSGRTFETAENISREADIKSAQTGSRYETRKVKGIQYDELDPVVLKEAKLLIEKATLDEIFSNHPDLSELINVVISEDKSGELMKDNSSMVNIEKLPKNIQELIAPIRQEFQKVGFEKIFDNEEVINSMAAGLSNQLINKEKILSRYSKSREKKDKLPEKDVVININTHGLFVESLLKNAGIFVKSNNEEIHGIDNMNNDDLGGYIQPTESIYMDIGTDPNNVPERIPVTFEEERDVRGKIYIDNTKLIKLSESYNTNKK